MKTISTAAAMMLFLAIPVSVFGEEQTPATGAPAVRTEADPPANTASSHSMHEMGSMHKGKGQQGRGDHGGKHGGGQHGKGKHGKHEQVVKRLDMIEARLAKIEAMLESLVRR